MYYFNILLFLVYVSSRIYVSNLLLSDSVYTFLVNIYVLFAT